MGAPRAESDVRERLRVPAGSGSLEVDAVDYANLEARASEVLGRERRDFGTLETPRHAHGHPSSISFRLAA